MKYSLASLLVALSLAGCAGPQLYVSYQDSDFHAADLNGQPLVLIVGPSVTLQEFRMSFDNAYGERFPGILSAMIADRLKAQGFDVTTNTTMAAFNTLTNNASEFTSENNATYAVCVRNIVIGEEVSMNQGTPMMSSGGNMVYGAPGSSSACLVNIQADIIDLKRKKIAATFTVGDRAGVIFFAYEAALKKAVERTVASFCLAVMGKPVRL